MGPYVSVRLSCTEREGLDMLHGNHDSINASSSTVEPLDVFITIACFGSRFIVSEFKIFLVSAVAGV